MSGKAVIVSGGTVDNYSFYSEILKDKYIICADGGIYLLQKLNIKPDMFLGDFDSCNFDEIKKTGFLDGCKDIKYKMAAYLAHHRGDTSFRKLPVLFCKLMLLLRKHKLLLTVVK